MHMDKNSISIAPVVILLYNRPSHVKHIIDSLSTIKPNKIYLVADGPSSSKDQELCQEARRAAENIAWKCHVVKIYSDEHFGLRKRVVTGLNEVFSKEPMAIILEDDCIPDPSFFKYCDTLLKEYKNNKDILSIAGFNNNPTKKRGNSYHFSKYVESWGWATWSRAWQLYDDTMIDWPNLRRTDWLRKYTGSFWESIYWKYIFDLTYQGKYDSWAYRWMYSAFLYKSLTAVPSDNLITNIGFGPEATHTKHKSNHPSSSQMNFPVRHPKLVRVNKAEDSAYISRIYKRPIAILGLIKKIIFSW